LQHAHLIYLLGASFVGIAFQPVIYEIIAIEIGFDRYVQRYVKKRVWNPFRKRRRDQPAVQEIVAPPPPPPPAPPERGWKVPRFGR
jgi:hypothetical protein